MRHANKIAFTVKDRIDDLVLQALDAARRRDWKANHKLCREHDDLMLSYLRKDADG